MSSHEIRKRFLSFFEKRGHAIIPSASLVPENDPTTLFTGSGMQPLLPYLLGEKNPKGKRLVNSQKSFRAEDIEEVGDNRHTTFFEMLGNWSLGDYWKEEQLSWFFEFLTKEIGLPAERLWVTCFEGDIKFDLPKDTESEEIWKKLGIPEEQICFYGGKKNWWNRGKPSPETTPIGDPAGPDSEVFFDFKIEHDPVFGERCHPNCDCGRFMEIGNSVFMQYLKKEDGSFEELKQKNVDFGGGLERISAASNDEPDIFLVDTLARTIQQLEIWTGKKYANSDLKASFRIIADHIRAAIFMINNGVLPSNTEQGYILRRLIRRAIVHGDKLDVKEQLHMIIPSVSHEYSDPYIKLRKTNADIAEVILREEEQFRKTLERGMKEFNWRARTLTNGKMTVQELPASVVFDLVTTYGFPFELVEEEAKERGMTVDKELFQNRMEAHRIKSRAGAEQKFKGGLADTSDMTVMLHTATHLLLAGLRKYLGEHVHQAGSNITTERTRFDFTHSQKVDRETLDNVEEYVNKAIQAGAEVVIEQMPKEEARRNGVEGSFWEKYPDIVNVYKVVDSKGAVYSRELCGGPHVKNTTAIEGAFKITKEEAVASGVRRIKAVLE